jgi:hypothetical protein
MLTVSDPSPARLAIDLAAREVSGFDGKSLRKGASDAEFRLPVRVADGSVTEFHLSVRAAGDQLVVKEASPRHLPACCPNRHINRDGSFCITWSAKLPIKVVDAASATTWWDTVYRFLQEQHRAARKRRWPTSGDWAHGDAAREQLRAETAAGALGGRFLEDLKNGRLTVKKSGHFYRLTCQDGWLYSVWVRFERVATLRQVCFCPEGAKRRVVLKSCGGHAKAAAELVLGIVGREMEERRFWKSLKDQPCCGTMDDCPLAMAQR